MTNTGYFCDAIVSAKTFWTLIQGPLGSCPGRIRSKGAMGEAPLTAASYKESYLYLIGMEGRNLLQNLPKFGSEDPGYI